jgi:hypothetical protein
MRKKTEEQAGMAKLAVAFLQFSIMNTPKQNTFVHFLSV